MSAFNDVQLAPEGASESSGVPWRTFGYLGRCSDGSIVKEQQSGKVTEDGGRDKRATSPGCSGGALRSTNHRLKKPLPASLVAHSAGTTNILLSDSNNLGASLGRRTHGGAL